MGFPDPNHALEEPDGLLAAGGALTPDWLLTAYAHGIFPWFDDDAEPILWWSPRVRATLRPGDMRIPRSLRKRIRNGGFHASWDNAFNDVIAGCSTASMDRPGTWITPAMRDAYIDLHYLGYAHSVEIWSDQALVGGLYGVSLGRFFFGESMFSRTNDASKIAFYVLQKTLQDWNFECIDCQMMTDHLARLGVRSTDRQTFLNQLQNNDIQQTRRGTWQIPSGLANLQE